MIPTSFKESNHTLNKPSNMSHDDCEALSVCITSDGKYPLVVSCWKLTKEELEEINRTGRVWLLIYGTTMPPSSLQVNTPFQ